MRGSDGARYERASRPIPARASSAIRRVSWSRLMKSMAERSRAVAACASASRRARRGSPRPPWHRSRWLGSGRTTRTAVAAAGRCMPARPARWSPPVWFRLAGHPVQHQAQGQRRGRRRDRQRRRQHPGPARRRGSPRRHHQPPTRRLTTALQPGQVARSPRMPPVSLVSSTKAPSRMEISRSARGRDPRVVRDHDQRLPGGVQLSNSRSTSRVAALSRLPVGSSARTT